MPVRVEGGPALAEDDGVPRSWLILQATVRCLPTFFSLSSSPFSFSLFLAAVCGAEPSGEDDGPSRGQEGRKGDEWLPW